MTYYTPLHGARVLRSAMSVVAKESRATGPVLAPGFDQSNRERAVQVVAIRSGWADYTFAEFHSQR